MNVLLKSFCFLSLLLGCSALFAGERYAVFLIDRGLSNHEPESKPHLQRAIDQATADVYEFSRRAEANGDTPMFKVATLNGETSGRHTSDWTGDRQQALEALTALGASPGFRERGLVEAIRHTATELTDKGTTRLNRQVYVYTDGQLGFAAELADNRNRHTDAPNAHPGLPALAVSQFADQAVWTIRFYGEPDTGEAVTPLTSPFLAQLDALTSGLSSSLQFVPDQVPQSVQAKNLSKFQYFYSGENSFNIYQHAAQLGNGARTGDPVSAVRLGNYTYIFYIGKNNDLIYYAWNNGINNTWHGNHTIPTGAYAIDVSATVFNGNIRVFFTDSIGIICFLESNTVFSNGRIFSWASKVDTRIPTNGPISVGYDPLNNNQLLTHKPLQADFGLFSLSDDGKTPTLIRAFPDHHDASIASLPAPFPEVYLALKHDNGNLDFARGPGYAPEPVGRSTSDKPGISVLRDTSADVRIYYKGETNRNISMSRTIDNARTWTHASAAGQTRRGLGAIGFTYTLPLNVSILGDHSGEPFVPLSWSANVSGGTPPYSYTWRWDGPVVSNLASYSGQFQEGTYSLELWVTDATGQTRMDSRLISIGFGCTNCLEID